MGGVSTVMETETKHPAARRRDARVTAILVVAGLWTLLHVYVGQRLLAQTPLAPGWRLLGWSCILLLVLAPFVALVARRPAMVRVVDVPITGLPSDLEGVRIAQLSDLHVGPTLKRDFVERVVDTTNGLQPDLIALTGDVADGFPPALRDEVAPLAGLEAPHGKYFVTGNHEYYWDAAGWVRELEGLGFSALINGHQVIRRGTGRIVLAGVTDLSSGGLPGHVSDPAAAVAGAPASDVRVLLAHQPKSAFAARAAGYDLQLSGHTHGGQYFPFNLLVRLFQPFVAGLHRLEAMWLYVSRGTGYWGPPLRLGAPAEITLIQLVRA